MDILEETVEIAKEYGIIITNFIIIGFGVEKLTEQTDITSQDTFSRLLALAEKYEILFDASHFFTVDIYDVYAKVMGRKDKVDKDGDKNQILNLDDGIYSNFYNKRIEKQKIEPLPISMHGCDFSTAPKSKATLFGPTCDSVDCLGDNFELPRMEIGDWIKFENCGYRCCCCSTRFNGIDDPDVIIIQFQNTQTVSWSCICQ